MCSVFTAEDGKVLGEVSVFYNNKSSRYGNVEYATTALVPASVTMSRLWLPDHLAAAASRNWYLDYPRC
jgi:hypothetical protein